MENILSVNMLYIKIMYSYDVNNSTTAGYLYESRLLFCDNISLNHVKKSRLHSHVRRDDQINSHV